MTGQSDANRAHRGVGAVGEAVDRALDDFAQLRGEPRWIGRDHLVMKYAIVRVGDNACGLRPADVEANGQESGGARQCWGQTVTGIVIWPGSGPVPAS